MRLLIRPQTPASSKPLTVNPSSVVVRSRPMRVLDFDIENRPLSYLGSDFTTAEVTAIAWAWCDTPEAVTVFLLKPYDDPVEMLLAFKRVYDQADMVTGHYIRPHDLPMLNGAMTEYQLPTLGDKLTQDTKLDLVRRKGMSNSQESIGAMLGLEHDKVQMNQQKWREGNRLTNPAALEDVRQRVTGDVQQHIEMRRRLLELGYLGAPVVWKSGVAAAESYTP